MTRATLFVAAGAIVVTVAILAAVFRITSPKEMRERRLDATRVTDLQLLAKAVDNYWTENGELPESISAIVENSELDLRLFDELGQPYKFLAVDPRSYNLCAIYYLKSDNVNQIVLYYGRGAIGRSWNHPAGEYCFELHTLEENS